MLLYVLPIYMIVFWFGGLYEIMWEYAGMRDLARLTCLSGLATGIIMLFDLIYHSRPISGAVLIFGAVFNTAAIAGVRFLWRLVLTMRGDTPHDVPTHLLKDADSYITGSGAFLRKTSLDELPQIYNILAGQMSVIGPRPALYNQYDLIEARDKVRANDIRPGLTGLAQVNGRDELPIDVKARYDGEYAAHVTFWNDVKIFFRSITYVFERRGVVEGGTGAMNQTKKEKSSK